MENEKYAGLRMYHPSYRPMSSTPCDARYSSQIYQYCNPSWISSTKALLKGNKIDPQNCKIIDAYLLQQLNLPDKPQDTITNKQVSDALKNMGAYSPLEIDHFEEAVKKAKEGTFLDKNK